MIVWPSNFIGSERERDGKNYRKAIENNRVVVVVVKENRKRVSKLGVRYIK